MSTNTSTKSTRQKLTDYFYVSPRFLTKLLLSVVCGALVFLSVATFDIWPLAWICAVPLLFAIHSVKKPRSAFFWGWIAGFVTNAGGFYWINLLLVRFGHIHWAGAFPIFLLLVAYQGLNWGLFAYLIKRINNTFPRIPMTILAPISLTTAELIMPFIFDWYLAISHAWIRPVIQVADLTGPLGVTFLLVLFNGMVYDLVTAKLQKRSVPKRALAIGTLVIAASLAYGAVRISQIETKRASAEKIKVGTVQANIGIIEKGRGRLARKHHKMHLDISKKLQSQGANLIVWPESSYPYAMRRERKTDYPEGDPRKLMQGLKVPLIFGVLTYGKDSKYPFNSAVMMDPSGEILGRYDKNYLLVFGEYIPFYKHIPQFKEWFPEASNFARGTEVTTFPFNGNKIGPLICYEDILPAFTRKLAKLKPNAMINITNDAWFGATSEPYQHLALSVYRSVELRLDLLRSVNTGVSIFIDATGKLGPQTKSYDPVITPGVPPEGLLGEMALMEGANTVYCYVGDLFGYLNATAVGILWFLTILPRFRKSKQKMGDNKSKQKKNGTTKRKKTKKKSR